VLCASIHCRYCATQHNTAHSRLACLPLRPWETAKALRKILMLTPSARPQSVGTSCRSERTFPCTLHHRPYTLRARSQFPPAHQCASRPEPVHTRYSSSTGPHIACAVDIPTTTWPFHCRYVDEIGVNVDAAEDESGWTALHYAVVGVHLRRILLWSAVE
jgi:hypothetical protein